MSLIDKFREQFVALRANYLKDVPRQCALIADVWKNIEAHAVINIAELTELCRLAHNIHGSARAFGFTDLSEKADKLEVWTQNLIKCNQANPRSLNSIQRQEFQVFYNALLRAIENSNESS